ncbi:MAG: acyl-CoA thioesterase [Bdellovibrionaceae bacterium]|nr:acyl-CoA thioesterase [Pseudobdellovibrionaceae bacterium]
MSEIVLPSHANALGSIFGGTIMSWIDIAGAISAGKHARNIVVTASIDALHFIAPVRVGHVVTIKASVNRAWRSSMEVGVRVDSEDLLTGKTVHNVTAYTTFVALDKNGKPTTVPELTPDTPEDRRRFEQALLRKESRLELLQEYKKNGHL